MAADAIHERAVQFTNEPEADWQIAAGGVLDGATVVVHFTKAVDFVAFGGCVMRFKFKNEQFLGGGLDTLERRRSNRLPVFGDTLQAGGVGQRPANPVEHANQSFGFGHLGPQPRWKLPDGGSDAGIKACSSPSMGTSWPGLLAVNCLISARFARFLVVLEFIGNGF